MASSRAKNGLPCRDAEVRGLVPGKGPPPGPFGPRVSATFQSRPLPKDDSERKILDVLNHLRSTQSRGMMNVPVEDGRLLRLLAESIGAKTVVEIGTSNGYSGIWLCLALRNTGGKLITHEIDPGRLLWRGRISPRRASALW